MHSISHPAPGAFDIQNHVGPSVDRRDVDGTALCCMFARAITGKGEPRYLSSDHDPLFEYHRWKANLRVLQISEVKTVPRAPRSHPFVERLIGTIRKEYLGHIFFWSNTDLEKKLTEFGNYYNMEGSSIICLDVALPP